MVGIIKQKALIKISEPQFGLLAKSSGEQLWAHHFTVWSIFKKMAKFYPSLDEKEKYLLEIACLFHDIGKQLPENQEILLGNKKGKVIHKPNFEDFSEQIESICEYLPSPLSKEEIKSIFDIILTHHSISDNDLENVTTSSAGIFTEILRYSDWLASQDEISPTTIDTIKSFTFRLFELTYFEVSRFASPFTNLILEKVIRKYKELNWEVLMVFDNGAIFIGENGTKYPEKEQLVLEIYNDFVLKSLSSQKPNPVNFTNVMLAGMSKSNPSYYLDVHKDPFLNALGDTEKNFSIFFKFIIEVFDNSGTLTGDIRKKYPILSILKAASGPRGTPNARKKWSEIKEYVFSWDKVLGNEEDKLRSFLQEKFTADWVKNAKIQRSNDKTIEVSLDKNSIIIRLSDDKKNVNVETGDDRRYKLKVKEEKGELNIYKKDKIPEKLNDMLKEIFSSVSLKDVIIEEIPIDESLKNEKLVNLKPEILLDILYIVARKYEKDGSDNEKQLRDYLSLIISMEEKTNFRKISQQIFERYKDYKTKYNADKGICERCGSPVTIPAKKSLGFQRGYGFSQVKTKPDGDRATCQFCAYDVMYLRENTYGNKSKIYLRIDSKIPDLFTLYPSLDDFIVKTNQGINVPSNIVKLEERDEFRGLPFSKRVTIPLPKTIKEEKTKPLKNERGILFAIGRTGMSSPKDLRAKYEPLYHLLNFFGFKTSIGTEEQDGLFGRTLITTEGDYYRSLATIILANVMRGNDKKFRLEDKKFVFASELFKKSPSVAIKFMGDIIDDKEKKRKVTEIQVIKFFEFIYKSNFSLFEINGGEYKMKDLLKHAAFFAEGIQKFCWTSDDWKKWSLNKSKHLISKPISKAMNDLVQGKDFDDAFARFMSHIRDNIAKEKSDAIDGPTTDVNELADFVKESKAILLKYAKLKDKNITEFIRAKNALMSAIYVFGRYKNLKEAVLNE